ncbi:hypothetical protein TNCT_689061 [Trichonephila clavata]|uniref:Uncharacterized protein n=1 Tax=Trichonephila clavata TaxID=2740835 RepID=A0A8X6M4K0_TRICU|nr:hypothetical protein TNCT_689061 [Trichonephila clavata]
MMHVIHFRDVKFVNTTLVQGLQTSAALQALSPLYNEALVAIRIWKHLSETTVNEVEETIEPIYNTAQNTEKNLTPTPVTQESTSQRSSSTILPKQTSGHQQPGNFPKPEQIPNTTFEENFSNMSFLVPSFIFPPCTTPSDINHPFAVQFCKYMEEKRKQKSVPFLKRKFKSFKKKFLTKIIHRRNH